MNLELLIVDDEPLIRSGIRDFLKNEEGIEIVGEAESGTQAINAILSMKPDLVLLDVQMRDATGLDVVQHIGPERMPAVIFVTAFDEYAVKAFELNAIDYLLKPFDEERLLRGIRRAKERISLRQRETLTKQLESFLESSGKRWMERFVVRNGERFDFVSASSIDWIESADNYVQIHCGQRQYLLGETLSSLEKRLDPNKFARVHRQRIVNLSRITAIYPVVNGTYEVELSSGLRLGTGRQFKSKILTILRNELPSNSPLETIS